MTARMNVGDFRNKITAGLTTHSARRNSSSAVANLTIPNVWKHVDDDVMFTRKKLVERHRLRGFYLSHKINTKYTFFC